MNELGLGVTFSAVDNMSGVLQRIGREILGVNTQMRDAQGRYLGMSDAARRLFKELALGTSILGAGVAGLAALAPATREAADFGKAIALVATESDLAVFPQKKMEEAALRLGLAFGKLPKDEATAMYEAVGMGANTAATATSLLTGANRLAVAGNADLKTTIDALGGAMRAYGADWSKANDYADTMFVAMTSGKTTVGELAASLGRVTSMSASLGLSFEETTAAISAMTSTGIEANMAVTGLHGAFANILHPAHEAVGEAARLGIKFDSVHLKAKGLMGFLQTITSAKGFKGVESMKKLFPSVEGFNAIMQITAGNMEGFKSALAAMGDKAGAAEKGFNILANTMAFQDEREKALKSTALILIGQALEPMAVSAKKLSNALLEGFTKIPAPVRNFLVQAFALASTLAVIVGGALAAKAAVAMLGMGMSALGVTAGGVLATLTPVLTVLGLVALAAAAFRTAYEANIGGFADVVNGVYAKVSLFFRALAQLFESGGFSGAVLEELDKGNQGVENFAIRIWGAVQRVSNFWDHLVDGFRDGLKGSEGTFLEFGRAIDRLADAFGIASSRINGDEAAATFDEFGNAGTKVGRTIADVATGLVDDLTRVISVLTGFAEKWDRVEASINPVVTDMRDAKAAVHDLAVELGLNNDATKDSAYNWISLGGVVGEVVGLIAGQIGNVYRTIAGFVRGIATLWVGLIQTVKGIVSGDWDQVLHGMGTAVYGLYTAVQNSLGGIIRFFAKTLDTLGNITGHHFGAQDALDSFLKSNDTLMRNGLGVDDESKSSIAAREANEVRLRNEYAMASSGAYASFAPTEPNASYYQPPPAAGVYAYASMNGAPPSADAIGGAVAQAMSVQPPQVTAIVQGQMIVDGQVLGEISAKATKASSATGEAPMSLASY